MKPTLVILAAVLLLAGCAGKSSSDVPGPSVKLAKPRLATFTSKAFHYAVRYDAGKLAAHVDKDVSVPGEWLIPGVGHVSAPTQVLYVVMRSPADLPASDRGEFELTVVGPVRGLRAPTLAAFSGEPYLRSLERKVLVASFPQVVKINGLPAFVYSMQLTPNAFKGAISPSPSPSAVSVTTLDHVVYEHGFVYYMNLAAPTPRWPSVEAALNSIAWSFRPAPQRVKPALAILAAVLQ